MDEMDKNGWQFMKMDKIDKSRWDGWKLIKWMSDQTLFGDKTLSRYKTFSSDNKLSGHKI